MKPYYQDNYCTIYLGDCLEIMPQLAPVDLVLTDPPYANGTEYLSYEDNLDNLKKLIGPLMDVRSQRKVITCGVANINLYPQPTWILSWITPAGTGSGPWGFCCWQPILVYGKDPYLQAGLGRRHDIFIHTELSKTIKHPCPKPDNIFKKIIHRVSISQTDTILDPFMGSGTTLVAAKQLNRKAIGIEIEEKYCEIAVRRLAQQVMEFNATTPRD